MAVKIECGITVRIGYAVYAILHGAVGEPALFTRTHEGELLDGFRLWIFKSNPLRRERVVVLERARPHSRCAYMEWQQS